MSKEGRYSRITSRQDKWLRPVCGPLGLVVELGRVPDNLTLSVSNPPSGLVIPSPYLVVHLWDLDRVGRRALGINHSKRGWAVNGVRDVVHVIGRVKVLPVPAAKRTARQHLHTHGYLTEMAGE